MSAFIFYHIFKTGQYVQDAKCIDPRELIIVEFARDVSEEWITIVHGLTIVSEKRIKNIFSSFCFMSEY